MLNMIILNQFIPVKMDQILTIREWLIYLHVHRSKLVWRVARTYVYLFKRTVHAHTVVCVKLRVECVCTNYSVRLDDPELSLGRVDRIAGRQAGS